MPKEYVRLALVQMLLIFLTVVLTGLALKGRFIPLPAHSLPMLVRNHGFLLLIAPAAWAIWAVLRANRPTYDTRDQARIVMSGIAMCLFFIVFAVFSVEAAFTSRGVVMARPAEAQQGRALP